MTSAMPDLTDPADDPLAASLRGFGPVGLLAVLVIVLIGNYPFAPMSAILVLLWAWGSRTPWREIGFVRPRSWIGAIGLGITFGIAFKLLMKAIVMPLLKIGRAHVLTPVTDVSRMPSSA